MPMPSITLTVPESAIRLVGANPRVLDPLNQARGYGVVTDWYTDNNGVRQYKVTWTW